MTGAAPYVGRFAPSPTGPLHFGSLLAAVASYLQARSAGGEWLLRIEDIDPPREQPGADLDIIRTLERFGFEWDGPVIYQSRATERHESLVRALLDAGHAYPCNCSRRDLSDAPRGPLGIIYPGTCRNGCDASEYAIRVTTDDEPVCFDDRFQGRFCMNLESESGDFVIKRRDGLIAYQLAVVTDDHDQGITEVVRGIDLLDSTPRHIHLQRLLGFRTPAYAHVPVAINEDGQKLSKLTGARALPARDEGATLSRALAALGQAPPAGLEQAPIADIWAWAGENWQPSVLVGRKQIAAGQFTLVDDENPLS